MKMNEKLSNNIKSSLKRAITYYNRQEDECDIMASWLAPFFDNDINVFYQPSDGFVLVEEAENGAPFNYPVFDVIETLKLNKDHYRSL